MMFEGGTLVAVEAWRVNKLRNTPDIVCRLELLMRVTGWEWVDDDTHDCDHL